jgi:phosphopantothenoylcysteine decarboxylase/phosphopantothenate--cysteine ligase
MSLAKKKFVLGVTGGIACYKSLDLIRRLRERGAVVRVIMTRSAMEFIRPLAYQAVSGNPVATSLFSADDENKIGHIEIVEEIDGFIIAPATANILGKIANGIADDYLSTSLLASVSPLFIAPAMNNRMWQNVAVQSNKQTLVERGAYIIPPENGLLACGEYGIGRMAQVETIVQKLEEFFNSEFDHPLEGKKVLVTAGPTQEKIDAVRYISNYSTGKMGYAIAQVCEELGAEVTLISGPSALVAPDGVKVIKVISAEEMYHTVMDNFAETNIIIKSAAVADYRVETPNPHKTKKGEQLTLQLTKNRDILLALGKRKNRNQILVGFAAESQNLESFAKQKLKAKNLDLIVANNILEQDAGFNADTNRVLLIEQDSTVVVPLQDKTEIARTIINHILHSSRWRSISESV